MEIIEDRSEFGYPVKHKRKVPFYPRIKVPEDFSKLNQKIFRIDGELDRFVLSEEDYLELIEEAFSSNIHFSTELEGNPLPLDEVRRVTRDTFREGKPTSDLSAPYLEIVNHLSTWLFSLFEGEWTIDKIKETHRVLMKDFEECKPGELRKERTSVITDDEQEVFIPAPPEHIEEELSSLVDWVNEYGEGYSPLVTGTVFFHEFESIHPFADGNGRVGRTLFHGYIQSRGLPNSKLCLIEKEILGDKELYYKLLAKTDYTGNYQRLIEHFTKAILKSYKEAERKFKERDLLTSDLDELSKRILIKAKRKGNWFYQNDLRIWCQGESDYRLRTRLNELVERGVIREKGRTKGKKYIFRDPIEHAKENLKKTMGEES